MKWRKFYRAKGFGGTQSILDTVSVNKMISLSVDYFRMNGEKSFYTFSKFV